MGNISYLPRYESIWFKKINDSGFKTFNLSVITFIYMYVSSLCNGSVQHRAVEEEVSSPAVAPSSHRQLTGRQSESRKSWGRVWRSRGGSPALWTVNSLKIWVNKLLFSSKTNYCVLRIIPAQILLAPLYPWISIPNKLHRLYSLYFQANH